LKKLLLIHGPNLNLLGKREPEIYGHETLDQIEAMVSENGRHAGYEISSYQSNHEGALIDFIQAEYETAEGIIINPGALTHYGYSLRDCLAGTGLPIIEVHISNIHKREEWRKKSILAEICRGTVSGLGTGGYIAALDYFKDD